MSDLDETVRSRRSTMSALQNTVYDKGSASLVTEYLECFFLLQLPFETPVCTSTWKNLQPKMIQFS